MTAKDIAQLNRLYTESTTTQFYAAWYLGYSGETVFHTITAANISDAIYKFIKKMYYGPGLDNSIPIEGDITIASNTSTFISADREDFAAVSTEYNFATLVPEDGWMHDDEHITDMIKSLSGAKRATHISAEEFIREYEYKEKALVGSNDEAGLGDMLDII